MRGVLCSLCLIVRGVSGHLFAPAFEAERLFGAPGAAASGRERACSLSQASEQIEGVVGENLVVDGMEQQTEQPTGAGRKRLWGALSALVAGGALILVAARSSSLDYYRDVDALVSSADIDAEQPVRVKGTVVPGTVEHDLASGRTRFVLQGKTLSVDVLFSGDPPPLFAPGREVVVSGHLRRAPRGHTSDEPRGEPPQAQGGVAGQGRQSLFEAYEVLTKCPSKYEALKATR